MTDLIFIRHGRTTWNEEGRFQGHLNSDLNEVGLQQAAALGKRFAHKTFAHVYSSDLGRAYQTAQALTESHELSIEKDPALRERCMGVFQGCTSSEITAAHSESWRLFLERDPDYRMPDGESINDVLMRAHGFLERVRQKHEGQCVAAVTHGGWIRVLMKDLLGLDQRRVAPFKVFNTSVHHLRWVEDKWWVFSMGDVAHLDESLLHTSTPYVL